MKGDGGEIVGRLAYAGGTEIWRYRNRSEKDTEVGLFLVLSVDIEEARIERHRQNLLTG